MEKLIELLRARLAYGEDTSIIPEKHLKLFLEYGLMAVNETSPFSSFTFEDDDAINSLSGSIVQYALICALAVQALILKNQESDILMTQYQFEANHWYERIRELKPSVMTAWSITHPYKDVK